MKVCCLVVSLIAMQFEKLLAEERAAEYGKWKGFYEYDELTGVFNARTYIQKLLAALTSMR